MPLIRDKTQRWDVWYAIFSALPLLIKKDRDDTEGLLFAMFPEFKNQLKHTNMAEVIKLGKLITASDRKTHHIFVNKVCAMI